MAAGDKEVFPVHCVANKSVYLLWSQIWAVVIFHENLSVRNIIGILVVLTGVWVVQRYE